MLVLEVDPLKVTENCLSNSNFAMVSLYHSDFQSLRFITEAENMPHAVMLATKNGTEAVRKGTE